MNNDIKITITCREEQDTTTSINVFAEQNYTPIFREAFVSNDKLLPPALSTERLSAQKRLENQALSKFFQAFCKQ